MSTHLNQVQDYLKKEKIDFAYISNPQSIAYLTGFESEPHERVLALVVFPETSAFLFTPNLDEEDARNSGWKNDVFSYQDHENPWALIASHIKNQTKANVGTFEKDHLPVGRYESLKAEIGFETGKDLTPFLEDMMVQKTKEELLKLKEAGVWADKAVQIGFAALKEGMTESEVETHIEFELKKQGCEGMSFSTIVLFGDHAASPHGVPGDRKLKKDELVLFDLGCIHEGYMSDMSRTVAFGTPSEEAQKIYEIVLKAQRNAIQMVRPGVTAGEIDYAARHIIEKAGYGEYFTHRLGHGIGKSIHEYPNIMQGNELVLKEGMCFSIEPGIYLPDVAGVRIEDCLVVTEDGCELFTHTSKEYMDLSETEYK